MVITYLGGEFFKVQFGDTILAFNPISKDSKLKASKFGADVALISLNHADMNGVEQVSFGEKKAFEVRGPGEYEIKGVYIKGFKSNSNYDGEPRLNTIYMVSLEGMNLCFLGAMSDKDISSETLEAIDEIDVLFAPIGGSGTLTPADAYKLAVKLEPKIIIPMHYDKASLKVFLKEGGEDDLKAEDKLTLKKKDLEGRKTDIVVLAEQN
jgi:L-ascorbate metabolism protein UlaG (beta-lactamase superfamily)